jgi:hypothetical protein
MGLEITKSLVFVPSSFPHLAYTFHSQAGMSNVFLRKGKYLRADSSELASPYNKAWFRTRREG